MSRATGIHSHPENCPAPPKTQTPPHTPHIHYLRAVHSSMIIGALLRPAPCREQSLHRPRAVQNADLLLHETPPDPPPRSTSRAKCPELQGTTDGSTW